MVLTDAFQQANNEAEILLTRKIHNDIRSKTAGAYFAIAQQHQYAIFLLLQNTPPLQATAFALLRPLIEAVIKGLWIKLVATELQVEKTLEGKYIKSLDQMIGLISTQYKSAKSEINREDWMALCSYTHSGYLQLQNWVYSDNVEPNYSKEAIAELINLTSLASNLAFHAVFTISTEVKLTT